MAEATTATKVKSTKPPAVAFEMPKFEMPSFDIPTMEVPPPSANSPRTGVAQAKDNYEKMKAAAEEATDVLEDHLRDGHQGRLRLRPQGDRGRARQHQCGLRFRRRLMAAKSHSDVVELSTHACAQAVRRVTAADQGTDAHAQKVATETAEPIKGGVTKALTKVA